MDPLERGEERRRGKGREGEIYVKYRYFKVESFIV